MLNEDFFMTDCKPGQIVRVSRVESGAFGRIARITQNIGGEASKIEFVDLPLGTPPNPKEWSGRTMHSNHEYLTPIEGVPAAAHYLFVTIVEYNGSFCYHEHCLAHIRSDQTPDQVAGEIARQWYEGGGQWDEEEKAYVFTEFDCRITVEHNNHEEITLGQYVQLRIWIRDCTPGYSYYAGAIASGL